MQTIVAGRIVTGAVAMAVGIVVGFFGFLALISSQAERSYLAADLIGAMAFARAGEPVGTVTAVTVGDDGQIAEISVTAAAVPHDHENRTVAFARGTFTIARGMVILDLPAGNAEVFPRATRPRTPAIAI
jgi:hypothetical protein